MIAEVKGKRADLVERRAEIKDDMKKLSYSSLEYGTLQMKKTKVEEEMKMEWYEDLEKRGEKPPAILGESSHLMDQYKQQKKDGTFKSEAAPKTESDSDSILTKEDIERLGKENLEPQKDPTVS